MERQLGVQDIGAVPARGEAPSDTVAAWRGVHDLRHHAGQQGASRAAWLCLAHAYLGECGISCRWLATSTSRLVTALLAEGRTFTSSTPQRCTCSTPHTESTRTSTHANTNTPQTECSHNLSLEYRLSFGQPYPGMEPNPLDGEQRSVQTGTAAADVRVHICVVAGARLTLSCRGD